MKRLQKIALSNVRAGQACEYFRTPREKRPPHGPAGLRAGKSKYPANNVDRWRR